MSSRGFWFAFALTCACITPSVAWAQGADDCASAQSVNEGVHSVDNTAATLDNISACPDSNLNVWFEYTATVTGALTIDGCLVGFDSRINLLNAADDPCNTAGAPCVATNDDSFANCGSGGASYVDGISVTAGDVYLISVGAWNATATGAASTGTIEISVLAAVPEICDNGIDDDFDGLVDCFDDDCVADPFCASLGANGSTDCTTPTPLAVGGTNLVDNSAADDDDIDPANVWDCPASRGSGDNGDAPVWYSYTASADATLQVTTDVDFSNFLFVFDTSIGDPCADDAGTCIGGDESGSTPAPLDAAVQVTAGTEYLIAVGDWSTFSDNNGTGLISVGEFTNSDCGFPQTVMEGATAFDTTDASASGVLCSGSGMGEDEFFVFSPGITGDYTVEISQSFDSALAVHDLSLGDPCVGDMACLGFSDSGGSGSNESLLVSMTSGTDYLIQVGGWTGGEIGAGALTITPATMLGPNGDVACTAATVISEGAFLIDNSAAADDDVDPANVWDCPASRGSGDDGDAPVWYSYTAGADGQLTVDTDCNFAHFLFVYDTSLGDPCVDMDGTVGTCITGDETGSGGGQLDLIFPVTSGTEYLIAVGDWSTFSNNDGVGVLNVATVSNDDCAFPDTLTEGVAAAWDTTMATASGVTCSGSATAEDRWFSFTAAAAFDYEVSLTSGDLDTRLSVYDLSLGDPCLGDPACLDTADGGGFGGESISFTAMAGSTYLIQVGGWNATAGTGTGDVQVDQLTVVGPNGADECAMATAVSEGIFVVDNTAATTSATLPTCVDSNQANEVWYLYTATNSELTQVSTCGTVDFDTVIDIFDPLLGDACVGDEACTASADDTPGCPGFQTIAEFVPVAGQQYLIAVGGWNGAQGSGFLSIEQFGNDNCEFATPVTAGITPWDNTDAATSGVAPSDVECDFGFGSQTVGADLFYVFSAQTDGDHTASLLNTTFDTKIAVYDLSLGDPCTDTMTAGLCVGACDDCTGFGNPEAVTWTATAGTDYLIQLGAFSTATGTGDLEIVQPAAAIINEIRIDQDGALDRDEFFELVGNPGEDLSTLTYIVIGDDAGEAGDGIIESVVPLTGLTVDANGFAVVATNLFTLGTADLTVMDLNFENSDNVTHLLVRDFTGANGDDLDADDDGVLDVEPWGAIVDSVSVIADDMGGNLTYGASSVGPDGGFAPGSVQRCLTPSDDFAIVPFFALSKNTPGADNDCIPFGDDCTDPVIVMPSPIVMGMSTATGAFDNEFATTDSLPLDGVDCTFGLGSEQNNNEIWFSYTAPGTGDLLVSACAGTTDDTRLVVYDTSLGDPCAGMGCIGADDDSCGPAFQSELTVSVTAGETYLVALGGFGATTIVQGTLAFDLTVVATAPVASASLDSGGPAISDFTVTLTDASDDGGDLAATIDVDWGDSSSDLGLAVGSMVSHTYTTGGTFMPMVTVTNAAGSDTASAGTVEVFLNGDCNGDGVYSLDDAIELLNVLFLAGSTPACSNNCDTNGDGVLSIGDVIASLSALFQGGPAPSNSGQLCD